VPAVQGSLELSCSSVHSSNKELLIVLIQANPSTSLRAAQIVQHMVLSNAKLLDSTRSKQTGQRQETNQANWNNPSRGINRNNRSDRNANFKPCVAYTGPSMVMEPGMHFSPADWEKLTKAQKSKLLEFKKQKRAPAPTANVSINNATTHPAPTTTTPSTSATTNNCDVCQLLSNKTFRDSSSVPSSIIVDGQTYTLSYCARTYSLYQQFQSPSGSHG
jgi:hypothetical protein